MKSHAFALSSYFLVLALALSAVLGAQTLPSPPKTVTEGFDHSVSGAERACLALARMMPEDGFGFVPTNGEFKGVRSFAQLARHIAVDNYLAGAVLLGEKSPVDPGIHENGPDSIQTKTQVVKLLADSLPRGDRGVIFATPVPLISRPSVLTIKIIGMHKWG